MCTQRLMTVLYACIMCLYFVPAQAKIIEDHGEYDSEETEPLQHLPHRFDGSMINPCTNVGDKAKYNLYVGMQGDFASHIYAYERTNISQKTTISSANSTAGFTVLGGINFILSDYFIMGVEGYFTIDRSTNTQRFNQTQDYTILKSKNSFGAATRWGLQLNPGLLTYIKLGWSSKKFHVESVIDAQNVKYTRSFRTNAFSPALGVELKLHENVSARIEYRVDFYQRKKVSVGQTQWNSNQNQTIRPQVRTISAAVVYNF